MQESTVNRSLGSDGARTVWPGAAGRPDGQPDAGRPDAPRGAYQTPQMVPWPVLPGSGGLDTRETADGPRPPDGPRPKDAAFPRAYARFEMNKDTQRLSIKIVDAVTDEVIREIPPDDVERIAYELQVMARKSTVGKGQAGHHAGGVGGPPTAGGVDRYV